MSDDLPQGRQPVSRLTPDGAGLAAGRDAPAGGDPGVDRWLGMDTGRHYASAAACFTNNISCTFTHARITPDAAFLSASIPLVPSDGDDHPHPDSENPDPGNEPVLPDGDSDGLLRADSEEGRGMRLAGSHAYPHHWTTGLPDPFSGRRVPLARRGGDASGNAVGTGERERGGD